MTDETINAVCERAFGALPDSIRRNPVGNAAYVYTLKLKGETLVLKVSETKEPISGYLYWLDKLRSLDAPIPRVLSSNAQEPPYYLFMSHIEGRDLGLVYSSLSSEQKRQSALDIHRFQNAVRSLPPARGYGFLHSYEDTRNKKDSWREVVESHIRRSEERIKLNGIFSSSYADRVRGFLPRFYGYFDTIRPEAFLDDATTKNVLMRDGRISGIVDFDWICFGDRLYAIALTEMSLLAMHADLEYVDRWKELERLRGIRETALLFYVLVFCIDFMSEKGMRFNKDEAAPLVDGEKAHLESVFEFYCGKLNLAIIVQGCRTAS